MSSKLENVFDEYLDSKVESAVETCIDNHDFTSEIESVVDNLDLSSNIEDALGDYDFSDVVTRIKEDIQEEVTDELKDRLYEAIMKKVEPLLLNQQAGLVPLGNDNAEARPRVRVTLTLTFERDYIADCVAMGKPNPTAEELQWLIRHSLQPMLKEAGEVVIEAVVPVAPAAAVPEASVAAEAVALANNT